MDKDYLGECWKEGDEELLVWCSFIYLIVLKSFLNIWLFNYIVVKREKWVIEMMELLWMLVERNIFLLEDCYFYFLIVYWCIVENEFFFMILFVMNCFLIGIE